MNLRKTSPTVGGPWGDLSKGEDFATRIKVRSMVPWGMYKGIEVEVDRNSLEGWWKYEFNKQKVHLGSGRMKQRLHSYGQIKCQLWFWSCQIFQNTYSCLCLQQPVSSANLPPTPSPGQPAYLLLLEHSRQHPALRSLLFLLPLPGMLFSQISFWLFSSPPSGLCSHLTSSTMSPLISIFNIATSPPHLLS